MKIAFICKGNSYRSQMAEGFARKYFREWEVYSAGSKPAGQVHPVAIEVMKEKGINISHYQSKHLEAIPMRELDLMITLCESALEECPLIPGVRALHWSLEDPAKAEGVAAEKREVFREIRNQIEVLVKGLA